MYVLDKKKKRIRYTLANPSFTIIMKVGFKGVHISQTCFPGDFCAVLFCPFFLAWRLKILLVSTPKPFIFTLFFFMSGLSDCCLP